MDFDIGPYLSGGRHVVTYGAGIATGVGITALGGVSNGDLVTSFNHVFNGLNEIAVGLGPIAAAGMGIWATLKGRLGSKIADVHAATPEAIAKSSPPEVVAGAASTLVVATKVVTPLLLLGTFLTLMLVGGAQAQTKKQPIRQRVIERSVPTPSAQGATTNLGLPCDFLKLLPGCRFQPATAGTPQPLDILQQVAAAALPDLEYAKMLSDAAGTPGAKVRGQCWDALIVSQKRLAGDPSRGPIPDPGLASHAELLAEMVDDLDLKGPLAAGCAGAAQMFKTSILQIIAGFLTGASGLAALGVT